MKGVTVHWLGEVLVCAEAWLTEEPALAMRGFDGQIGYRTLAGLTEEAVASVRVLAGPGTLLPYVVAAVDERVVFGFAADARGRLDLLRHDNGAGRPERTGVRYEPDAGHWCSEAILVLNQPLFGALPFPEAPLGPRSRLSTLAGV